MLSPLGEGEPMILQRIAASLKKRDWGTVVLEVAIVVVGIFIGLQVDDWNQRRQDRALEQQYLERLYADMLAQGGKVNAGTASTNRVAYDYDLSGFWGKLTENSDIA